MAYILSYDNKNNYLQIKFYNPLTRDLDLDSEFPFLFNNFSMNVNNVIFKKYQEPVATFSTLGLYKIDYSTDNLKITEEVTDMLFSLENYKNAEGYLFFDDNKFEKWSTYISKDSKGSTLRKLFENKKISLDYLLKNSDSPYSLYEFSKYTLFNNIDNISYEKISGLPLPDSIKNDLKLNLSIL